MIRWGIGWNTHPNGPALYLLMILVLYRIGNVKVIEWRA